jgi:lipid A disaccharide synthetase
MKIENIKNCSVILSGFGDSIQPLSDFLIQNNITCENIITSNVKAVITAEHIDFTGIKSAKLKRAITSGIPIISLCEINQYKNKLNLISF